MCLVFISFLGPRSKKVLRLATKKKILVFMGDKEYHFVIENNQPKSPGENFDDLKIESPPKFDFEALYRESRTRQTPPNAFILYRTKYLQALKRNGHSLPMSRVSKMASESWKRVDKVTKMRYNDSAKKAALLWKRLGQRPRVKSKRKRVRPSSPASADNVTELSHIISLDSDDIADESRQPSLDEHHNQAVVQSSSSGLVEPEAVVRNPNDTLQCDWMHGVEEALRRLFRGQTILHNLIPHNGEGGQTQQPPPACTGEDLEKQGSV